MPIRLKKLIGTILLIALVIVYALVATTVAVAQLGGIGPAGAPSRSSCSRVLWILPAMGIIKWMMLPPRPKNPAAGS